MVSVLKYIMHGRVNKYGGMSVSNIKNLKALGIGNNKLKKNVYRDSSRKLYIEVFN